MNRVISGQMRMEILGAMNKLYSIIFTICILALASFTNAATFTLHGKTGKTTLADADVFGIEDSAAGWAVKHVDASDLKAYVLSGGDELAATFPLAVSSAGGYTTYAMSSTGLDAGEAPRWTGSAWEYAMFDLATPSTLTYTTDTSITAANLLASKFVSNYGASGEVDLVLPAVSYNISRTIIVEAAQIIEVCPPSGELFDLNGTLLDADDCIDSPATAGSKAVFTRSRTGASTWRWSVDPVRGSWVDTGASDD